MRRSVFLTVLIVSSLAGAAVNGAAFASGAGMALEGGVAEHGKRARIDRCGRIVSLAPSVTEILFDLGLGPGVIGVTRYCDYPEQARKRAKVGGYYDVNYEAVLTLEPDLAILLTGHDLPKKTLSGLGLKILQVDHGSVKGILDSIQTIGDLCGVQERARALKSDLEEKVRRIWERIERLPRPRVLVAVGRNMDSGSFGDVYFSGRDGFYDQLITLAGGVNAYTDSTLKFPALSVEGIVRINPQVVVEMVPDQADVQVQAEIARQWSALPEVEAVSSGRIHIFVEDFVVVPGPRFILLLEKLARVIHPEVDWDDR